VRIALDAMGTDTAPEAEVAGAIDALREFEPDVEVILVGDEAMIRAEVAKHGDVPERLLIHHAPDRVTTDDPPASVIRRKPDSSVVVGLKLQQDDEADAFVSAGSTGAVMATSLFTLRPLPGVDRPAIGTLLPTVGAPSLLIDSGANVDCKPHHLIQFAHLGSTYVRDTLGRENPRVALLNVGEEPGKGSELVVETHGLLAVEPGINFVGNIEGRDFIGGEHDVVVCDGFVGNILLKFYESVAPVIVSRLHEELDQSEASEGLKFLFHVLDYAETGGAPLLGVGGVSIICHGESTPKAIKSALAMAAQAVRSDMVKHSARDVQAVKVV
jgi:glycerol-3-phosphate acyltransferase PlsX